MNAHPRVIKESTVLSSSDYWGLFHKKLLLVSFDREMAMILRKKVVFWDVLLYLLIGLTVSMTALSVGSLIAFGFLLIPALTAHQYARNMRQFTAGLFDRGRYGFFRLLGRISMGFAGWPDGCCPPWRTLCDRLVSLLASCWRFTADSQNIKEKAS